MKNLLFSFLFLVPLVASAQYVTVEDASSIGSDCFQLTPDLLSQRGAVWSNEVITLNNYFRIEFTLDLGVIDGGNADADGATFTLQSVGTGALGGLGGALGYADFSGMSPSLAVAFINYNDDQIEIWEDGGTTNLSIPPYSLPYGSGPQPVTISWNPDNNSLTVDYGNDGVDLTYSADIINDVFSGNPEVYFGFTAATGGQSAEHIVCIENFTTRPIPTLSQWGIIGLSLIMLIIGLVVVRQRKVVFG